MKVAISTEDGFTITRDHFGEGNEFLIYELSREEIKLVERRINSTPEEEEHGSREKARAISSLLNDIPVLVGYQFGPNILRIKDQFLPVLSKETRVEKTLELLKRHYNSIEKEAKNRGNVVILMEDSVRVVKINATNAKDF